MLIKLCEAGCNINILMYGQQQKYIYGSDIHIYYLISNLNRLPALQLKQYIYVTSKLCFYFIIFWNIYLYASLVGCFHNESRCSMYTKIVMCLQKVICQHMYFIRFHHGSAQYTPSIWGRSVISEDRTFCCLLHDTQFFFQTISHTL